MDHPGSDPTGRTYRRDVMLSAHWYRRYCGEPPPENLHQETAEQGLSALTVKTCPRLLLLPLDPVDFVARAVARFNLGFHVRAQPLIDPKAEDDQDPGNENRSGIKHERNVVAALAENQHEPFDEHGNRNRRDKFGEAAARLRGKTHLASADDFLLDEILRDVEHGHRDDD